MGMMAGDVHEEMLDWMALGNGKRGQVNEVETVADLADEAQWSKGKSGVDQTGVCGGAGKICHKESGAPNREAGISESVVHGL